MNSVPPVGTQPAGAASTGGVANGSGSVVQGNRPGLPWVRTGNPAAATAAGLVEVWSTIRLLISRGWASKTDPVLWAYDENGTAGLPGPKNPGGAPSADPNTG